MNWLLIGLLTTLSAAAQESTETAQSLNTEGNRVAESGNYAEARRLYQESIRIWRKMGPEFDGHTAGTMLNLAVALCGDGQRQAASKVFEEALGLHRRMLGARHHHTLANMNLAASNYLMLGDPERAEGLLQEALPILREFYPEDIQTARTLEGLSNLMVRRGLGREALAPAEEALRIAIHSAGEESLEAALAYTSVGEAHRFMGSPERALPLFRRARFLYEKALGAEHPRVATLLSQEGLILMGDGKLSMAEQTMVQAVKTLRKACPECVVELSIAQSNLGLLRLKQRRYREADEALTMAVELREKFAVKQGPELADALQTLALARRGLRLFDDAARLNSRAHMIRGYR
ncbi:MAG: tetratricopeptide repeat protein [Candidatus Solibacter sp.]|nr:tetratricopeptide repeat protein [Candidatus Solibacter sp.]